MALRLDETLLDCERTPKRAYFVYQESLVPLKVHLYSPRKAGYEGETLNVQMWVFNDTGEEKHLTVHAEVLEEDRKVLDAFEEEITVSGAGVLCTGKIPVKLPGVHKDGQVTVQAAILKDGKILHQDAFQMDVYQKRTNIWCGIHHRRRGSLGSKKPWNRNLCGQTRQLPGW